MIKRFKLDPKNLPQLTKSQLARLDAMKDEDIDLSDIPELGPEFFARAKVGVPPPAPPPKEQLTVRVDADVLKWLKSFGRGYQTRLNHILRAAMEAQSPRRSRSRSSA
jgi:uncharacterized protein (DUF4415 family)